MSFVDAIENAQKMPELPEELADQMPDILSGGGGSGLGSRVETPETPAQIQGVAKFEFDYQCARLVIGPLETGYSQGQAVYEYIDDSARLKEIMDKNLSAEAIIFKKETTFMRSGAVIVWIEWGTPKEKPTKASRDYLTHAELSSPSDEL